MKRSWQMVTIGVSCLLTFFIARAILILLLSDHFFSVIPGWHTTLSEGETPTILTATLLLFALLAALLFKLTQKVLNLLLNKIRKPE
jgi:Na+/H+ antiporter NhaD/arsenite permease-like protein